MDSANKQTAVVAETVVGTTPTTPAFKVLRDIRVSGAPQRPNSRSPERRSDRMMPCACSTSRVREPDLMRPSLELRHHLVGIAGEIARLRDRVST